MAHAQSLNVDLHDESDFDRRNSSFADLFSQVPAWLLSTFVHTGLLLTLALLTVTYAPKDEVAIVVIVPPAVDEEDDFDPDPPWEAILPASVETTDFQNPIDDVDSPHNDVADMFSEVDSEIQQPAVDISVLAEGPKIATLSSPISSTRGTDRGLGGRDIRRKKMIGTPDYSSEADKAVQRALKWLARHQYPNGGWSFDHTHAQGCNRACGNPGTYREAVNGATAMGLLPFLGMGITHQSGPANYRKTVYRGLQFLGNRMKPDGSFYENGGTMYSHGLAAICLTEAYGMTKDRKLLPLAQKSIDFIVYAQDPNGGGWRYKPRQQGDTSVVGWQLMAMKSGYMAYLNVPAATSHKAMRFLDSVQANNGSHYGYLAPSDNAGACTAIGLLSRMYYGWERETPALENGVQWLSQRGPSTDDMYYNYYASQVMRHYGGSEWQKWNKKMTDILVDSQVKDEKSHACGSWFQARGHDHGNDKGGRLYKTSLSAMTLEVAYRFASMYRESSLSAGLEL